MSQGPSCPNCRSQLRWFPQLQQWGCDRCQVMIPPQALAPSPGARSRNTLWIVLGAAAVVGGGVAVALLTVGNGGGSNTTPATGGSDKPAHEAPKGTPCELAAAAIVTAGGRDADAALANKLPKTLALRCDTDKWKPEVVDCLERAGGLRDVLGCNKQLTPDQQRTLRADITTVLPGQTPMESVLRDMVPIPPETTVAQSSAGPPPLPPGVKLGPPERTDVGDFWLVPRSDGEYVITSPLVTATFPSKPTIKVAKATTVNADGKPFDIYSFAVEQGTVLYQLQIIALGRNARDEGGFAKVEQELGKLGPVTKASRKEDGQDITRFTVSQGGSTLLLDGRIDLPRGLLVNSTTVTDGATRAVGDQFLASVRIKRPPDPLEDPNTLVGVRVRKTGKKLVAHDKTDSFTVELPWQPTVVRTPDPKNKHDIEVALTATKGKATVAFVVSEQSPWDALSKSPTKISALERDDLASMEKLAGGRVMLTPITMGGLTGSKIEPIGRAKQKVSSYLVVNPYQHRMYRLVCLAQPCDAVAKSLHFADTTPDQP